MVTDVGISINRLPTTHYWVEETHALPQVPETTSFQTRARNIISTSDGCDFYLSLVTPPRRLSVEFSWNCMYSDNISLALDIFDFLNLIQWRENDFPLILTLSFMFPALVNSWLFTGNNFFEAYSFVSCVSVVISTFIILTAKN